MTYNSMINCHMALATGDDSGAGSGLTAWRNADAAFVAGELQAMDNPLGWTYKPLHYETRTPGAMTASRVSDRYSAKRNAIDWKSVHAFQTCQFVYWLMQTVGTPTTEGTPAGYNTHTLTIGNTTTPDWHGIHFERESIASNELRYDFMGALPTDLIIEVGASDELWIAKQYLTVQFANKVAGSDIAAQTPRPATTTGTIWKSWDHVIAGNGGGSVPSGLTYNNDQLECDVTRLKIYLHRGIEFSTPDINALYTIGLMKGWNYIFELDVIPTGGLIYSINGLKKESYAGDLDYDFKFEADATNDNIRFLFDKMYMREFDENNDYNKYIEGYTLFFEPLDTTSSLTVTGIDGIDNTGFENP
jgi:hypothetical protein